MSTFKNKLAFHVPKILPVVLFVVLAITVLVQANPGTRLPSRDYGFYVYIGDLITQGKIPYQDAWESKPPAIFYLNAVGLWIGRGSRWGVWIIECISLFVAIYFSYSTIKKLWGPWSALAATCIWLIGLDLTLQGGNFTEEYPLPLHFISFVMFLKLIENPKQWIWNILLGLMFGLSFLFRPNNAIAEVAMIMTLFIFQIIRRDIKTAIVQVLWLMTGILPPVFIVGYYFWSYGILRDLLDASIFYNIAYSTTSITSTSPLDMGFFIFGFIAWIAAAGYGLAVIRLFKRDPFWPVYVLLLIGWPMAIFLSDPAKRNYPHYFINWLPFIALLSGLAVHTLITLIMSLPFKNNNLFHQESIPLGISLLFALSFLIGSGRATEYQKALDRISRRDVLGIEIRSRVSTYVQNHTTPGDEVLFWGGWPGENFMSNRASPSAYLFYPLFIRSDISDLMSQQFLQDIVSKRPILIVDMGDHEALSINSEERARQILSGVAWEYPPDNLDEFFKFVDENYYLDAKLGNRFVYRLHQ